jgi:hypothetical protein
MRCYMVKADGCVRLAATGGEARAYRQAMIDEREGLRKKDVEIQAVELKTAKPELLGFANGLLEALDDAVGFELPEQLAVIDKEARKAAIAARKAAKESEPAKRTAPVAKKAAPAAKKPVKKTAPAAKKPVKKGK